MTEEMLKYYNTLTTEQQKEAFDFIIFLWGRNNHNNDSVKTPKAEDPIMGLFGIMSETEAAELRTEKLRFKEAQL